MGGLLRDEVVHNPNAFTELELYVGRSTVLAPFKQQWVPIHTDRIEVGAEAANCVMVQVEELTVADDKQSLVLIDDEVNDVVGCDSSIQRGRQRHGVDLPHSSTSKVFGEHKVTHIACHHQTVLEGRVRAEP